MIFISIGAIPNESNSTNLSSRTYVGAGELDRRFDYFFSGNIVKEQSGDEEPLTIANDVLKWIPSRLCSFSVVYHKWSNILVTGYIYEDKKHGYFTVRKLAQLPVNIDLTDGRMNIIQ